MNRERRKYYVKIEDKTLPVEVNVAIDEGLWYLVEECHPPSGPVQLEQHRRYGNHYGNTTASAVQAFESQGHLENQPWNPYSEAVTGGIDYLTANLYVQTMSLQGGQNPDSNGNGIGLSWNSDHPIYETGAVMDALVATGTPAATARTGEVTLCHGKDLSNDCAGHGGHVCLGPGDSGSVCWADGSTVGIATPTIRLPNGRRSA